MADILTTKATHLKQVVSHPATASATIRQSAMANA
jgi:hypothetical protein